MEKKADEDPGQRTTQGQGADVSSIWALMSLCPLIVSIFFLQPTALTDAKAVLLQNLGQGIDVTSWYNTGNLWICEAFSIWTVLLQGVCTRRYWAHWGCSRRPWWPSPRDKIFSFNKLWLASSELHFLVGLPWGSVLDPFSLVLARILLGQFGENPPSLICDQIPYPPSLISNHPVPPSTRILLSPFSQNPPYSWSFTDPSPCSLATNLHFSLL